MGVITGRKCGGKHGYVGASVRERTGRGLVTMGWQGRERGGIGEKRNFGRIVDSFV